MTPRWDDNPIPHYLQDPERFVVYHQFVLPHWHMPMSRQWLIWMAAISVLLWLTAPVVVAAWFTVFTAARVMFTLAQDDADCYTNSPND